MVDKNIWKTSPSSYSDLGLDTLSTQVYPKIIELLNNHKPEPQLCLDFGCGDGRLLLDTDTSLQIHLYDISNEMLERAQQNLEGHSIQCHTSIDTIPKDTFDVVICSMVLVCLRTQAEVEKVLTTIYNALKDGGSLILASTHPCFRQYSFSDFSTSYVKGQTFNYLKEGEPFDVIIQNSKSTDQVKFEDYHWSLAFTINELIKSKFRIQYAYETSDDLKVNGNNPNFCPHLILMATKYKNEFS